MKFERKDIDKDGIVILLFYFADFSLKSWLRGRGLTEGVDLSQADARQLESAAGLSDYLEDTNQCVRTSSDYQSSHNDGWNKGI
jgi:hypothetical protein